MLYLQTWMYLAIPMFLYACERLIRALRSGVKPVKILKVIGKATLSLSLRHNQEPLKESKLVFFLRDADCLPIDLQVAVYPGNVLTLQMSKPNGFKCKSGQYIFVNCASVSPFEW